MRFKLLHICLLCLALISWPIAHTYAQQSPLSDEGDLLRVSLLTCSPGKEVYALYGHTAIRVTHLTSGIDEVYNYGLFDFNSPNFGWRFALGQTDYYLGKLPYSSFEQAYLSRGSHITEQVINLTPKESKQLLLNLEDTLYSPNRVYRYNYFFKNCSSMARDAITHAIDGEVTYKLQGNGFKTSFRAIIHEYTSGTPWNEFGQDILLGYGADTLISLSDQQFTPQNLLRSFTSARIKDKTGVMRPLVIQTNTIGHVSPADDLQSKGILPLHVFALLLTLTCVILIWEKYSKRTMWGWDIVLMILQGIPGILIAFLALFSEHPTVNTNWIILLLNPFPLFYLPCYIRLRQHDQVDPYNVAAICVYSVFLLSFCLQWQWISTAIALLAFNLLILHGMRCYQQYRSTKA